jgi:hypothetical protein
MLQKKVVEELKARILCSVTFFLFENRTVSKIMWKNMVQRDRPTDGNMAHAHLVLDK